MEQQDLTARLTQLCQTGDRAALTDLAARLGFVENGKSAANLLQLHQLTGRPMEL
jgi:hypothetical protein